MSTALPPRPIPSFSADRAFAIVASEYNGEFTGPMMENARRELLQIAPDSRIEVISVPGSFEIPLAVQLLAEKGAHRAIIALGVILKGETAHADLIAQSITEALQRTALRFRVPVIHEVLLLANASQAAARCLREDLNRGIEAARCAVRAANAVHAILGG